MKNKIFFNFFIKCLLYGIVLLFVIFALVTFGKINFYEYSPYMIRKDILNSLIILSFCLIPTVVFSLLTALLLSRSVTVPVKKITKRAEGLEKGELYSNIDDIKCEEFKDLIRAINHMGFVMAGSIQKMNSEKHLVEVILENINNGIMTFNNNQSLVQINSSAKKILAPF